MQKNFQAWLRQWPWVRSKLPYNVVVRQLGGVGDMIMLSCLFRGLREKYPMHRTVLVTSEEFSRGALRIIAEHNIYIDEIADVGPMEVMTTQRSKDTLPDCRNAALIDYHPLIVGASNWWDMNNACIDYEIGECLDRGRQVDLPRTHIWCNHANVRPSSYAPVYKVTQAERNQAYAVLRERGWGAEPLVGVSVLSEDMSRSLPIGQELKLLEGLRARGFRPIVIGYSKGVDGFDALVNTPINEVIALIEQMDAVVCVDSGVLHMAGAVGTPIVGLFGPTDPRMRMNEYVGSAFDGQAIMPCAPCWYRKPCTGQNGRQWWFGCMKHLPVDLAVEETARIIGAK